MARVRRSEKADHGGCQSARQATTRHGSKQQKARSLATASKTKYINKLELKLASNAPALTAEKRKKNY